ncbi:hypothetical protein CYMTET_3334, partial [Cymbomonas tetramitiformis]
MVRRRSGGAVLARAVLSESCRLWATSLLSYRRGRSCLLPAGSGVPEEPRTGMELTFRIHTIIAPRELLHAAGWGSSTEAASIAAGEPHPGVLAGTGDVASGQRAGATGEQGDVASGQRAGATGEQG